MQNPGEGRLLDSILRDFDFAICNLHFAMC